jgi:hypothetical protein
MAGIAAVVATLGFVHGVTKNPWATSSRPSGDAQPTSGPTAPQTVSSSGPYPSDDRGFINSSARCDGPQTAVAIVRTQNSLVTICADQQGGYLYRGVRLSDGAALNVPAETTGGREFVARSEGVTYSVSTQQLVITAGDTVVRREPVLEYRESHSFSAEVPPGAQTSASPAPSTRQSAG